MYDSVTFFRRNQGEYQNSAGEDGKGLGGGQEGKPGSFQDAATSSEGGAEMKWRKWFEEKSIKVIGTVYGGRELASSKEERRYQAYKARLMDELKVMIVQTDGMFGPIVTAELVEEEQGR